MEFGITGVAGVTVICYLAAQLVKATPLDKKWLPGICGLLGAILGAIGLYTMPGWPSSDILDSIAIGIVSGFGATGVHQMYKQMKTKQEEQK